MTTLLSPEPVTTAPERAPMTPLLDRHNSAWRAPLAAACLVTAAAHVPVTGEHLREAPYIGVLFILLEIASEILAVGMLRRPPRVVYLAIAAVGGLAILALVVSRTIGLPLIGDDIGNWTEPLAVVSLVAESVMVVGGLVAGLGVAEAPRRRLVAGLVAGVMMLALGGAATGVAAVIPAHEAGSGTHHTGDMSGTGHMSGMHMGLGAGSDART